MNYTSKQKNYIHAAIFAGSVILTRFSASLPAFIAHICTIGSTVLLLYLSIPVVYDMYHRKTTADQGTVLRNTLLLVSILLVLRWVEGHFLGNFYDILVTINLTAIAVCAYVYLHVYIIPYLKDYVSKSKRSDDSNQ